MKVYTVIEKGKDKLLRFKNQAVAKDKRLRTLWSIYTQPITYYKLSGTTKDNQKDSFDLIFGRIGCRRTYFTQKLATNKFFG